MDGVWSRVTSSTSHMKASAWWPTSQIIEYVPRREAVKENWSVAPGAVPAAGFNELAARKASGCAPSLLLTVRS